MANQSQRVNPCQRPTGWVGRLTLWRMNRSHSKVTDWGLTYITIEKGYTVLDVGCGGGRTVNKLAAMASQGKVYGADFSEEAVAVTKRTNARWIESGRVEVHYGSVSQLPFPDGMFDVVTAIETHFWWPSLPTDMREVFRVLKPGGRLIIIAEVYKGANALTSRMAEKFASASGMALLTIEEHRDLLEKTGYSEIQVTAEPSKGWICCVGKKPMP